MQKQAEIIQQLNEWGKQKTPFVFLIDFKGQNPVIFPLDKPEKDIFWNIPGFQNEGELREKQKLEFWKTNPILFEKFIAGYNQVMWHIRNGDTYLLNYTQPTQVETNLSLEEIFHISSAPYKIYLKDKFVCFSPEPFVKIENGKIYSFPDERHH
jgi:para-aminobenzoate synthetase component I